MSIKEEYRAWRSTVEDTKSVFKEGLNVKPMLRGYGMIGVIILSAITSETMSPFLYVAERARGKKPEEIIIMNQEAGKNIK